MFRFYYQSMQAPECWESYIKKGGEKFYRINVTEESEFHNGAMEGFWHNRIVGWRSTQECDHPAIMSMFAQIIENGRNSWYNGASQRS